MKKANPNEIRDNFKREQNDNVFMPNEKIVLSEHYKDANGNGMVTRKGMEYGIMSNGKLVNMVSSSYGHLPNERFFLAMEEKLEESDIRYTTRSINRNDCTFAVDYILTDPSYEINVKGGKDIIKPMIRCANSYVGGNALGYIGFWRKVCDNGNHVGSIDLGFKIRHSGNVVEIAMPKLDEILIKFMDNQFYSLHKKFEVLAERPITDLKDFVRMTANDLKIFKFEKSDKNAEPSANAEIVLDIIRNEARELGTEPNFWLGYNAFNEIIGKKLVKTFEVTRTLDNQMFDYIYDMALAQ